MRDRDRPLFNPEATRVDNVSPTPTEPAADPRHPEG